MFRLGTGHSVGAMRFRDHRKARNLYKLISENLKSQKTYLILTWCLLDIYFTFLKNILYILYCAKLTVIVYFKSVSKVLAYHLFFLLNQN